MKITIDGHEIEGTFDIPQNAKIIYEPQRTSEHVKQSFDFQWADIDVGYNIQAIAEQLKNKGYNVETIGNTIIAKLKDG